MQTVDVVRVEDAEGRLNERQLNYKFDACGTAQAKISIRSDAQLPVGIERAGGDGARKASVEIIEARGVEPQRALAENAIGAAVKKQHGLERVADDGDAVLDVSVALRVASRKSDGIAEHGNADGSRSRLTKTVQAGVAGVGELLRGSDRDKSDRSDRANVKTANIRLAAHIKAAIRRRFPTAV